MICLVTTAVSAVTDIKYKKVKNIVVLPAMLISGVLNIINCIIVGNLSILMIDLIFMIIFAASCCSE